MMRWSVHLSVCLAPLALGEDSSRDDSIVSSHRLTSGRTFAPTYHCAHPSPQLLDAVGNACSSRGPYWALGASVILIRSLVCKAQRLRRPGPGDPMPGPCVNTRSRSSVRLSCSKLPDNAMAWLDKGGACTNQGLRDEQLRPCTTARKVHPV